MGKLPQAVARLRRSDCSGPGIQRRRRGRGFEYRDDNGERITDSETIERIAELSIPPAWKDVWICSDPMGHLQATGIDAAGRKQYLYHQRWRERRDQQKFDEMLEFARALPRMRRRVAEDLAGEELDRDRVLACALRLLDRGFFRIGGEDYAERNETYGLATMQRRHVRIEGDEIVFEYEAKGGQHRVQAITDPDLLPVIERLRRRRSSHPELLAYKNGRGSWTDVRSDDVNAYLKEAAQGDFSAKDFRTWHATVLAAFALASADGRNATKTGRKRAVNDAVKGVAAFLGNTPAVCRRSYIDPRVIDRYRDGATIERSLRRVPRAEDIYNPKVQRTLERAVIRLIEG
jgi:DNA topoisomerase-1